MDDPRCNTGADYGVYGRWNTASVGTGPACVKPFKEGDKNGGATAPGVTADSVKVVAVMPSAARVAPPQSAAAGDEHRDESSASTYENAVHDYLFANKDFYEQWGRDDRRDALHVDGHRRDRAAGRRGRDQGDEAVRRRRRRELRPRHARRQTLAKDKILIKGFDVNKGDGGGRALPVGQRRRRRGGGELRRGDQQAARRQEGRVRR